MSGHALLATRARIARRGLDRQLAAGVAPERTSLHAARAAQLLARGRRSALAETLEETVREARLPGRRHGLGLVVAVTPDRAAVAGCAAQLADLAAWLRGPEPVRAEGVASLAALLRDGAGPLYTTHRTGELERALHRIARALGRPD